MEKYRKTYELKYIINNEAYIINENEIKKVTIEKIRIVECKFNSIINANIYDPDKDQSITIDYFISYKKDKNTYFSDWFNESKVYLTKEEIINSL